MALFAWMAVYPIGNAGLMAVRCAPGKARRLHPCLCSEGIGYGIQSLHGTVLRSCAAGMASCGSSCMRL